MTRKSFLRVFTREMSLLFKTTVICSLPFSTLYAATWFVAPDGKDTNAGTIDAPFATMQKGHDKASAGDTVYLRGGTYKYTGAGATSLIGISITKSGKSDTQRINFWAYGDEVPVLDFSDLKFSTGIGAGIRVQGQWLHFRGIEICNVQAPTGANNGIWCNPCTNNIFERLNFHHNQGPGLSIAYGDGGLLILNCDSHDNFDVAKGGEDGDGFGIHYQTKGDTSVMRGCRAWNNADDGYDLFKQQFPVLIENCWAYGNGFFSDGKATGGNGSGFKMGNSFMPKIRHTIRNCVSWKNRNQGFYANHSPGGTDWYNNTAYNNGYQFDMYSDSVLSGSRVHELKNNVAFPNKNKNLGASIMEYNSWNLNITPANSDFLSISDSGWTGQRRPDGSLPDIPFLKLKEGGNLIDKGTDVGLAYIGKAPDLGAYEYGQKPTAATPRQQSGRSTAVFFRQDLKTVPEKWYTLSGQRIRSVDAGSRIQLVIRKEAREAPRIYLYTGARH